MLYLIHLHANFGHARHYLGYAENQTNLIKRINQHVSGTGSKFLKIAGRKGITFHVARIWNGDREKERSIKEKCKKTKHYCPYCMKWEEFQDYPALREIINRNIAEYYRRKGIIDTETYNWITR